MSRAEDLFKKLKEQGEDFIDELISTRHSEELFLDFKRSSDNGEGRTLSQIDRGNLAKAISGFGNSEGGIIIWGIECSMQADGTDAPTEKFALNDAKKFASQLEGSISGLTLPPHSKIENHVIEIGEDRKGFVVTYIPQLTTTPIQIIQGDRFYIRAGSNFSPAPYQVLAGMFGRRPNPKVYHMYTMGPARKEGEKIVTQVGLLIHNEGPGIARDVFLNAKIMSFPSINSEISFGTPDRENWTGGFSFGRFLYLISKDVIKIPPDAHLQPVILNASFAPPFEEDLKIEITCGCEGSPAMKAVLHTKKEILDAVYNKYINTEWSGDIPHKIVKELFGHN